MERLHLSVHCAEPGRKYNERKSAERFLCYQHVALVIMLSDVMA